MMMTTHSRRLSLVPSLRALPPAASDPDFAPAPIRLRPGHQAPRAELLAPPGITDDEPLWQTILGCMCFAVLYGLLLVLL
jgi:hypothetical protein